MGIVNVSDMPTLRMHNRYGSECTVCARLMESPRRRIERIIVNHGWLFAGSFVAERQQLNGGSPHLDLFIYILYVSSNRKMSATETVVGINV